MSSGSPRERPPLDRFWERVAARLERNGLRAHGRLQLDDLDRTERHALAGLLGRPVAGSSTSIDLAALDERIRASGTAAGLLALAERNVGSLVNRPGLRAERAAARDGVWLAGREALTNAGLATQPWVEPWLDDVRRAGALGRIDADRGAAVLSRSVSVIAQLPLVDGRPPVARGDLASRVAGSAHALDDGTALASIVLRAVSLITGSAYAMTPTAKRSLWRAAGVQTDEVSTTVLTIGLRTDQGNSWLNDRTSAGWETHLTLRDLRRIRARPPSSTNAVFVCENPRVLEMALDAGSAAAAVCTQGQPSVVVSTLLGHLRGAGVELRYHGDFDWPGVTIANLLVGAHGCVPWRMGADDYLEALARLAPLSSELPLLGDRPVESCWDDRLAVEMAAARRAIHEELVLEDLLGDMAAAS